MTGPTRADPSSPGPDYVAGRRLPAGVVQRHHVLDRGVPLVCDRAWYDVFAIVEHGEVDLETAAGGKLRLIEGDSLCFALTGPTTLHAVGPRAVIAAITRRPPAVGPAPGGGSRRPDADSHDRHAPGCPAGAETAPPAA
ncbi:hypothetical protein ACFFMR_13830 [Micromonospora andamanensis]|uniref:Cupin domain-containing protein n=1 Tax=Micromonospora andamanensis TaxID=1287068 RepID=A0ABQ4I5U2_9ACTN|nr:hypothetical protein [Micromonospora andamanensis]GIJ13161.1 hypothetical protein Van01_63750 [Micromonospora andamanensis]